MGPVIENYYTKMQLHTSVTKFLIAICKNPYLRGIIMLVYVNMGRTNIMTIF